MWLQKYLIKATTLFLIKCSLALEISDREYASMPTLFHFDDYDNCMLYGDDALYCRISFQLYPQNSENVSETWKVIQKVSSAGEYYKHDLLRHWICVTTRCPNISKLEILGNNEDSIKNLSTCYEAHYKNMGLNGKIETITCQINQSPYTINSYDTLYGVVITLIILLTLYAWCYDVICNPNFKDQKLMNTLYGKYISSFSIAQNWKHLLLINLKDPETKMFSCLQGIRFCNVTLVIIYHTGLFNSVYPVFNPQFHETKQDKTSDEFYIRGTTYMTLQIFFLMSSWLLTFKFCKECEGRRNVSFSYVVRKFFSRYFRLTPLMAVIVLFSATWMPYVSRGPLWYIIVGKEYESCRKNWWTNLVYLNNFLPIDENCGPHMWSLAVDTHFYIIGLLILWFLWNHPKKVVCTLGGLWLYHLVGTFLMIYEHEIRIPKILAEVAYDTGKKDIIGFFIIIYKSTTTNIPGLLAGIVYGYASHKYKNRNLFTRKVHIVWWWTLSLVLVIGTVIFPKIIINLFQKQKKELFRFYIVFGRSIFVLGLGLFIFGMTQGQGGIIKKFSQWTPFHVLGRLTYAAYLVHPYFQRLQIGQYRKPVYLNGFLLILDSLGHVTTAFLTAVPLTLIFVMPFEAITARICQSKKLNKNE